MARLWRLFRAAVGRLQEPMRRERETTYRACQSAARLAFEDKWDRSDEGKAANAAEDARRAAEDDDVAIEIRQEFIRDELQHRMRGLGIAVDRDGKVPLCKCRLLQAV